MGHNLHFYQQNNNGSVHLFGALENNEMKTDFLHILPSTTTSHVKNDEGTCLWNQ